MAGRGKRRVDEALRADAFSKDDAMTERRCRCEATIPAQVLEGFSCGMAECWRAPLVQASFDAFVAELIRARGEEPPAPPRAIVVTSG